MAKAKAFTYEELNFIKNEYMNGCSVLNIANKLGTNFGVIQNRLKKMNIYIPKNNRWSQDDIAFLKNSYSDSDWDYILNRLSKWTKQEITSKASSLGLKRNIYFWSERDIKILKDLYDCSTIEEIEKRLNYKFTQCAIMTKARLIGLYKRDAWTVEDDDKLKNAYSNCDMNEICDMFPNRSKDAIIAHASKLGLMHKTFWSHDEVIFLREHYQIMSDEEISVIPGRSKDSVRGKRFFEKLYRPVEPGCYNYLSEYIRKRNTEWKKLSAKKCEYKCVITGDKFQDIHHLYGMNRIIKETLLSLNYPENISINQLSQNDIDIILKRFYEVQNKYPLGICLTSDIHRKFHDVFGYGDNTPDQFNEFCQNNNYKILCSI